MTVPRYHSRGLVRDHPIPELKLYIMELVATCDECDERAVVRLGMMPGDTEQVDCPSCGATVCVVVADTAGVIIHPTNPLERAAGYVPAGMVT